MAKFFHLPRNKRFNYQPRYYNERAERRKEREAIIIKELEEAKAGKKNEFSKEDLNNYIKLTRNTRKKSNIRLLIIAAILLLLCYYMFYH